MRKSLKLFFQNIKYNLPGRLLFVAAEVKAKGRCVMKRSQINQAIQDALHILENNSIRLPSYAYWTPEQWKGCGENLYNLQKIMLGWDVTDFGSRNFDRIGGVLFTIRNGCPNDDSVGTPYAEKLIILRHKTRQTLPMHFHRIKTEDIINRGGGTLVMQLYASTERGA